MKQLISIVISFLLLTHTTPAVAAKQTGDWESVKNLTKQIAIKTKRGEMHYGLVDVVDDNGITIQLAGRDDMTSRKVTVKREDVVRVWRARLRFGEDNVKKATWMGAAAGVAVVGGLIAHSHEAEDAPAGALFVVMIGAGAGAVLGRFWKKNHNKLDLVYSI